MCDILLSTEEKAANDSIEVIVRRKTGKNFENNKKDQDNYCDSKEAEEDLEIISEKQADRNPAYKKSEFYNHYNTMYKKIRAEKIIDEKTIPKKVANKYFAPKFI